MSASLAYAEALAAAVRIEENGELFYRKAAALSPGTDAAGVFLKLAAMEAEHRGYFSALALDLEQRESLFLNDPSGAFTASIRDMADTGVFNLTRDPARLLEGASSAREAAEFALGMEKDSVLFYLTLQEAIADREEADKVGWIIKEEMRHIAILSGLIAKLKTQHTQEKP